MERTQVYLGEEELALLEEAVNRTGASRSELIRRAIRKSFSDSGSAGRLAALENSAGSWRNRAFTGAEYVDGVRSDLAERLHKLGLE